MSDYHSTAHPASRDSAASEPMTLEFAVPSEWSAGLALAFAEMMQEAIKEGFPIVVPVRKDALPEQISQVLHDVRRHIQNIGLAAAGSSDRPSPGPGGGSGFG